MVRRITICFFCFFCPLYPPPSLAQVRVYSAVLLYCCCTVFVHTLWVRGLLDFIISLFFLIFRRMGKNKACWMFFFCCSALYYCYVLLLYCCCARWLGGSVRGCVHGFVSFFLLYFFPLLYRHRAVIVRRTIIDSILPGY